jgi:hypothetical protein
MKLTSLATAALVSLIGAFGCVGADDGDAYEQDLSKATTIARGLGRPDSLTLLGDHVYFGQNKFIASGDPELDQQFAYWTGKFSRVATTGGARELISEGLPIAKVRKVGSKLYYNGAGACWISTRDARPNATDKLLYTQDDCEPEIGDGVDFEFSGDKLVIIQANGEIRVGRSDGTGMVKKADVRVGDQGITIDDAAVSGNTLFLLTPTLFSRNGGVGTRKIKTVDLNSGTVSDGITVSQNAYRLRALDSKVAFAVDESIYTMAKGDSAPKLLASGFGTIADIAVNGDTLYVADSKRAAIVRVAADGTKQRLVTAKGVRTVSTEGKKLVFGTEIVEGRKLAGTIGLVQLP